MTAPRALYRVPPALRTEDEDDTTPDVVEAEAIEATEWEEVDDVAA